MKYLVTAQAFIHVNRTFDTIDAALEYLRICLENDIDCVITCIRS